jgi:thiol-disulfide isomerase/thioredoxin
MRFLPFLFLLLSLSMPAHAEELKGALEKPYPAPSIKSSGEWLNSPALTDKDLKGKVVLIDFWTYSCINCLRTLSYLKAWHETYKDQGLVILGVHSPEFDFEKNKTNVEKAVSRFKLRYPIVMDNDMAIWDRFKNRYWPAHYLINRKGQVVYTHFGEGQYDVTENNIRALLAAKGDMAEVEEDSGRAESGQTPETYLGTSRMKNFVAVPGAELPSDHWALDGKWTKGKESVTAEEAGSALRLSFRAGKVFLVMGSRDGAPVTAKITLNGMLIGDKGGKDVAQGMVDVTEHRLYELASLKEAGEGVIGIEATRPGLQLYAFTFGAAE